RLVRNRSLLLLIGNGFFGVFPWQVITFWFFRYLETERGYESGQVLITMVLAVLVLASGYPAGGAVGDWLFRRTVRGRMIVSAAGVIIGAVLLAITLSVPSSRPLLFGVMLCLTAFFIPFAAPNVASTVYDVTLPEVRSTDHALLSFCEQLGSSTAPALAGLIAVQLSLGDAILYICTGAWLVCFIFLALTAYYVPRDVAALRAKLQERAEFERLREANATTIHR
ncbi:MAG: MFS transporter, partial [Chloroflexi bacterium]|nr:MFS transporter [Chloroflexota bacterium]